MQINKYKYDVSIVLPSRNEGENVGKVLDELITELSKSGRTFEIIALDSPAQTPSYDTFVKYADKYPEITVVNLAYSRVAGNDKGVKYMIGFNLAQGKYIIHLDSDGQDNPADIHKFIAQLDKGTGLVVGYKQNRKDGFLYNLSSRISNKLNRTLTGVDLHDMNCGFKGYQSYVAKSLNLKGRWYRFIPALVAAKGISIAEVPIENRKREWGSTNFNFRNRLEGGIFDQMMIIILNMMGETPTYFFGWSIIAISLPIIPLILGSILLEELYWKIFLLLIAITLFIISVMLFIVSIMNEYWRSKDIESMESYGISDLYRSKVSNN